MLTRGVINSVAATISTRPADPRDAEDYNCLLWWSAPDSQNDLRREPLWSQCHSLEGQPNALAAPDKQFFHEDFQGTFVLILLIYLHKGNSIMSPSVFNACLASHHQL